MKELKQAKREFDTALSKTMESSKQVKGLVEDTSYEELSVSDIDVSPDGEQNR